MEPLFPEELSLPFGFIYKPDFISISEEQELIDLINNISLKPMMFKGFKAKRLVNAFGYNYHFDTRTLTPATPIPHTFQWLVAKVADFLQIPVSAIAQMLLTRYDPGTVINWHRDAQPFDVIAGISLSSDCRFKLRPYHKEMQNRRSVKAYNIERRSIYIMKDAARQEWEHRISPVAALRYSITFRTLRHI